MLILTVLYILFFFNLFYICAEAGGSFYKDPRFWATFISLIVLIGISASSYDL